MMVSRIFRAVSSSARTCASVSAILQLYPKPALKCFKLRDFGGRVIRAQDTRADNEVGDTVREELVCILKRDAAVYLERRRRMVAVEYNHLLKDASIKGLPLFPDLCDAHALHIINLAHARLNKCEVARDINRGAVGHDTAIPRTRRCEEAREVRRALSMEGEPGRAEGKPRFSHLFGVVAHQINLIRDAVQRRQ